MKKTAIFALILSVVLLLLATSSLCVAADRNTERTAQRDPDFALQDLSGRTVHFSDFRGKVVVLNFWATWCAPCRVEIPWFIDLQKQYGPQGLQILGISMDDADQARVTAFARRMGINYPILLGTEINGVQELPITLYFGRDGKPLKDIRGLWERDEIETTIRQALAAPTPDDRPKRQRP
jgi:thiol-disulfide isomerase/thioredoxin